MIPSLKTCLYRCLISSSLFISGLALMGCGGGGGGDAVSPPTVRPKTLDELVLTLDGKFRFAFNRTIGTPAALVDGNIETGTFLYTATGEAPIKSTWLNIFGATAEVAFPDKIQTVGYTYEATNSVSGIITLRGFDLGASQELAPPYAFGVTSDDVQNVVTINIVFQTSGDAISVNNIILKSVLPATTLDPGFIVPASIETSTGDPVLQNYNPTVDPNRPSEIAPETLDGGVLSCVNGIPEIDKNFTVVFTKDGTYTKLNSTMPDEVGKGQLTVAGVVIVSAFDYTWKRTGGTDDGVLVLSNIPNAPELPTPTPFDVQLNGSITLKFKGNDNGDYVGVDAARSGTFLYVP